MQTCTNYRALLPGCVFLALALVGCQGAPEGKYLVQGTVTWNGEPIEHGYVQFEPEDGNSAESGKIVNGSYQLYAHPGANNVIITATREEGYIESMNQPGFVQYIPPKYNDKSELSASVEENHTNQHDFLLTEE